MRPAMQEPRWRPCLTNLYSMLNTSKKVPKETFWVAGTWFLRTRCPSWQLSNSVKAVTDQRKHWRLTVALEFLADSPLYDMAITRHWHQHLLIIGTGILGSLDSHPLQLPHRSYMATIHTTTNTHNTKSFSVWLEHIQQTVVFCSGFNNGCLHIFNRCL